MGGCLFGFFLIKNCMIAVKNSFPKMQSGHGNLSMRMNVLSKNACSCFLPCMYSFSSAVLAKEWLCRWFCVGSRFLMLSSFCIVLSLIQLGVVQDDFQFPKLT